MTFGSKLNQKTDKEASQSWRDWISRNFSTTENTEPIEVKESGSSLWLKNYKPTQSLSRYYLRIIFS
jgi:hypothetical protein